MLKSQDFKNVLTLKILGSTTYQFIHECKTAKMESFGIGIAYFDVERKRYMNGVMTRDQAINLRNFLDKWISNN